MKQETTGVVNDKFKNKILGFFESTIKRGKALHEAGLLPDIYMIDYKEIEEFIKELSDSDVSEEKTAKTLLYGYGKMQTLSHLYTTLESN